jgi:anionic cell wall polymer biosynthesis LytR-Cps2A-Psr (LCP) family protein
MMLVCFAAGAISVLLQGEEQDTIPQSTPFESIEIAPTAPIQSGAVSILVLGVDEIKQDKPKILSIWFISFQPPDKKIQLLGIPTDLLLPDTDIPLSEAFSLWEAPDYGADFITAMDHFSPNPISGIAVLDEQGFSALIDYLGGFSLDNQSYDGASAIGTLRLLENQPLIALKLQALLPLQTDLIEITIYKITP